MTTPYEELCNVLMVPGSARLARILSLLGDENDARLLLAMPGTAADLATATGLAPDDVAARLAELFHRGVAFRKRKPEGTLWRAPRHLIQLHDASVQWAEAPREFLDTWKELMSEEYLGWLEMVLAAGFGPFVRAIPSAAVVEELDERLPTEDVLAFLEAAEDLAVCRCPCRLSEGNCDTSLEVCLQLDAGARYAVERGTGRAITRAEATAIVREAGDKGLVHVVESRQGMGTVICNCCHCCCAILQPYRAGDPYRALLAPSRYRVAVDAALCVVDEVCAEQCPVDALSPAADGVTIEVDPDLCIGCGVCVPVCPTEALALELVRPADHLPG